MELLQSYHGFTEAKSVQSSNVCFYHSNDEIVQRIYFRCDLFQMATYLSLLIA